MPNGEIFKDLIIVLAVAGIVVPLFGRLSFTSVAGFLLAGVIVGPNGVGRFAGDVQWLDWVTFSRPETVQPFAELGVLFVLFLIGLGLPVRRLFQMRRLVLGLGTAQVLLTTAVIAFVAFLYGAKPGVAIALGLGFALSSTAVVAQLLSEQRRIASPIGRAAMAVLLFQDAMVVPIVIIIGLLGRGLNVVSVAVVGAIGLAIVVVALIVVAGRFLVTPLIRVAATNAGREAVVAITLLLVVGSALLTEAVGLSTALGAFLAGLLIGESEYRHQIEVDIDPFKGLLLGLFFMTVGMTFDPALLLTAFVAVLASVAGLIVLKAVVLYPVAVAFGVKRPVAAELAILLAGAGEFAFVVLTLARNAGLVQQPAHQFFVAVATLALLLTPLLAWGGRRARAALEGISGAVDNAPNVEAAEYSDHVVIGGFGRIGRLVADVMEAEGIPYVGLDLDADLVAVERAAGRPVFYGDSARREMLERVGAIRARAFVVTTDEAEAEEGMVRAIREVRPDAVIHARAKDLTHAQRLRAIGATSAVPETLEASLQLAAQVLAADGLPETAIASRVAHQRRAELALMQSNTASLPPGGSARDEGARPAPAPEQAPQ